MMTSGAGMSPTAYAYASGTSDMFAGGGPLSVGNGNLAAAHYYTMDTMAMMPMPTSGAPMVVIAPLPRVPGTPTAVQPPTASHNTAAFQNNNRPAWPPPPVSMHPPSSASSAGNETRDAAGLGGYAADDLANETPQVQAARWKDRALVKDNEVRLLRQMVDRAREEISKRESSLAAVVQDQLALRGAAAAAPSLDVVEKLERELSEKEYVEAKLVKELEASRAAVAERDESMADMCANWERAIASLKQAREQDLAELRMKVKQLEEVDIPAFQARAEAAETASARVRQELAATQAALASAEARYTAQLGEKDRLLAAQSQRVSELELDMEHVMAAASKFVRPAVLSQEGLSAMNGGGASMALPSSHAVPPPPAGAPPTSGIALSPSASGRYANVGDFGDLPPPPPPDDFVVLPPPPAAQPYSVPPPPSVGAYY